jgi:hypothetical protein
LRVPRERHQRRVKLIKASSGVAHAPRHHDPMGESQTTGP